MNSTRQVGANAEDLACRFLKKQGYKIITRNFTIRGGEIDIIAQENGELVFIEVKARYSYQFGLPQESITYWKIKALRKTALFFLQKACWGDLPYRFDLVCVDFVKEKTPQITLSKNIIEEE